MRTQIKVQYVCCGEEVGADYLVPSAQEEAVKRQRDFLNGSTTGGHRRQVFLIMVDEHGVPLGDDRQ